MDKKKLLIIVGSIIVVIAVIISALLIANKKTITYDVFFETNGGSKIVSQTVNEGEKVAKPTDPTKDGYMFIEWIYQGRTYDFSLEVTSNLNLIAKWAEIKEDVVEFVVKFETDGGTTISNKIVEKGNKVEKPSDPAKDGYIFKGWTLNGEIYDFETVVEENIELKANWEKVKETNNKTPNNSNSNNNSNNNSSNNSNTTEPTAPTEKKYTVSFNSNGGNEVSSQTITEGNKAIKPADPIRDGYTFEGWTLNGNAYDFNSIITRDITLFANWKEVATNNHITTPTLKNMTLIMAGGNSEYIPTLVDGKYGYDLGIDKYVYGEYESGYSVTGYIIYEKTIEGYKEIETCEMTGSETVFVEVEPGEKKEYTARVYELNSENQKVYSEYSNVITIDYSTYKTPTLKNMTLIMAGGNSEYIPTLVDGKYYYDLGIDKNAYGKHEKGYSVTGYTIYEKTNDGYKEIETCEMTGSETVLVAIEPGEKKEYTARVYALNSKNQKIYSAYSNVITINHSTYKAPILKNYGQGELDDGNYIYDLGINTLDYYNKADDTFSVAGYEVYEKSGTSYTCVASSSMGGAVCVEIETGTSKTFVARVYVLNSKNEKVYSAYSNELVLDNSN